MFSRALVANRGETAIPAFRAAVEPGATHRRNEMEAAITTPGLFQRLEGADLLAVVTVGESSID